MLISENIKFNEIMQTYNANLNKKKLVLNL